MDFVAVPCATKLHHLWIGFRCPDPDQVAALAPWFDWLQIDSTGFVDAGGIPARSNEAAAGRFLGAGLALTIRLLQAAGVPVFDASVIGRCRPAPARAGHWQAMVGLPAIDQIDAGCYDQALQLALRACLTMAQLPCSASARVPLNASLASGLRELSARVPHGQSTIALLREAHARDIPFIHLGGGVYQLGWGSKSRRSYRGAWSGDAAIGAMLARSKAGTATILRRAGQPVPVHGVARTLAQARRLPSDWVGRSWSSPTMPSVAKG